MPASGRRKRARPTTRDSSGGSWPRCRRWCIGCREYAALGITGVSIGSNDLTQLMLGVDRDSELFGAGYDERDAAVLDAIRVDRHDLPRARAHVLDLRAGAVGTSGVRRRLVRVGNRFDLGQRGRDRPHETQHCRRGTVAHPGRRAPAERRREGRVRSRERRRDGSKVGQASPHGLRVSADGRTRTIVG